MSIFIPMAVLLLIPSIVCLVNSKLYSGKLKNVSFAALSAVLFYLFILVSVAYIEIKLDVKLASFDLNGDGTFSGNEITPEQEEAMHRVISDTARTLAPVTGAVFSIIYFLGLWLLLTVFRWT